MNSVTYADSTAHPICTDAEIEDRVLRLIGSASKRQVWALFLDDRQVQRELVIPVDDFPVRPDMQAVDHFMSTLGEIIRMHGGGSLIVVRERPGPSSLDRADVGWIRMVSAGCRRHCVELRAQLLSHDDGGRWLPADDGSP